MSNSIGERYFAIIIIASPSGGGKNTVINRLRELRPEIQYSISVTTRPLGNNEIDGQHYYFVTPERFKEMIAGGELIEYEQVHGYYYGTPRANIDMVVKNGGAIALDLDVKGALHLKEMYPFAETFFLLPPSIEVLRERLQKRRRESDELIDLRLKAAREEISRSTEFDYRIVNDDLNQAVAEIFDIIDRKFLNK